VVDTPTIGGAVCVNGSALSYEECSLELMLGGVDVSASSGWGPRLPKFGGAADHVFRCCRTSAQKLSVAASTESMNGPRPRPRLAPISRERQWERPDLLRGIHDEPRGVLPDGAEQLGGAGAEGVGGPRLAPHRLRCDLELAHQPHGSRVPRGAPPRRHGR
jgi:hypothetical protein